MLDKVAPEKTVKFVNKPINTGLTTTLGTKAKLSKRGNVFEESTDNNTNGKLIQKRETYTVACLSTTRNKSYQTK